MKLIIVFILGLFSKCAVKTTTTVGGFLFFNKINSQTYTSGGNTGFNSWSVYQTNSPTNTYGNRYNCVNINRDSIVLRTKYVMLDSMYGNNSPMVAGGKLAWLDGRQMKLSRFDSLPISTRQVTAAIGYMPSSLGTLTSGYGIIISGTAPNQNIKSDTAAIMYTSKTFSLVNRKLNITDTTGKWMPVGTYDRSITNELQTLSGSNTNTITLSSGGGSFVIPTQTTALTSSQVTAALGAVPLFVEVDGSTSNEIQTLSINNNTLSISSGNSVNLPTPTFTAIAAGSNISVTSGSIINNTAPDQVVSITAGTPSIVVSGTYPNFVLTPYASTSFTTTRAVNGSTFQVSSTKRALVFYTIRINCTATIGGAASGTVALQYSIDNGSNWIDAGQVENSNTVTLAVVLNSSTTQCGQLGATIPAGAIVRMNSSSAGTTTITFVRGNETY